MSDYSDAGGVLKDVRAYVVSLTVPTEVTKIYGETKTKYAFYLCRDTIENIVFPDNSQLVQIQPYAFYSCSKITSIDLSMCSLLERIDSYAFSASKLSTIKLPCDKSLSLIGGYAFSSCTALTKVFLPKTLTSIGTAAFLQSGIENVTFEKSIKITTIPERLFQQTPLKAAEIPKNVINLMYNWAELTESLSTLTVEEGNKNYYAINNVIYDINSTKIITVAAAMSGTFDIPDGIQVIGGVSFKKSHFSHVNFPSSVTTIEGYAFQRSYIVDLFLPDSITAIGEVSFSLCNKLKILGFHEA